jgi:hypothetical protein
MSDDPNKPSKHTTSIPLKKETVRVTLKASDVPASPSASITPVAPPTVPVAPSTAPVVPKPPTPTVGGMPRPPVPTATGVPPAPAPTIPLKTAGPLSRPTSAPTIKLNTGGAGAPAPTIPLKTAPMAGLAPATKPLAAPATATKPLTPPLPGATVGLPKATVQLQPPTQPLISGPVSATQMATFQAEEEEEDAGPSTMTTVLSIFGFLAACAVLAFQCMTVSVWNGWEQLF